MPGHLPDSLLSSALVFGTYNRLPILQRAVDSFRRAFGSVPYRMVIVDGGSTDGTIEYLREQSDIEYVAGDLGGAVPNFNLGFERALDLDAQIIGTQNDDNEALCPPAIFEQAIKLLLSEPQIGGVAMEMDIRGRWECEEWAGVPYANTGFFRREVGMAIARAQGDPTGRAWWDRRFKTYASDTVFGIWLHRLGWEMRRGIGLRVHDTKLLDGMKRNNARTYQKDGTANLFAAQFGRADQCGYSREDAIRFGGLVR